MMINMAAALETWAKKRLVFVKDIYFFLLTVATSAFKIVIASLKIEMSGVLLAINMHMWNKLRRAINHTWIDDLR